MPMRRPDCNPRTATGCTEFRTYDELNRAVQVQDALNGVTVSGYDLLGNVTGIRDATSKATTFVYDDLGRLATLIDPLGKATAFARDEAGNAYQVTNALIK